MRRVNFEIYVEFPRVILIGSHSTPSGRFLRSFNFSKNFVYERCRQRTQLSAGYSYDLFQHTVWSLQIYEVRFQCYTDSGQPRYTDARSGFWATRW
jgi:hypothetical protein